MNSGHKKPHWLASIISAILGFIYVVFPVDFIPDFIPVLGQIDDPAILLCTLIPLLLLVFAGILSFIVKTTVQTVTYFVNLFDDTILKGVGAIIESLFGGESSSSKTIAIIVIIVCLTLLIALILILNHQYQMALIAN